MPRTFSLDRLILIRRMILFGRLTPQSADTLVVCWIDLLAFSSVSKHIPNQINQTICDTPNISVNSLSG